MSKLFLFLFMLLLIGCSPNNQDEADIAIMDEDYDFPFLKIFLLDQAEEGEIAGVSIVEDQSLHFLIVMLTSDEKPYSNQTVLIDSQLGNDLSTHALVTNERGEADFYLTGSVIGLDTLNFNHEEIGMTVLVRVDEAKHGSWNIPQIIPRVGNLEEKEGFLSWSTLAKVQVKEGRMGLIEPIFSEEVKALNKKTVKVQGFMMPLETTSQQKHFLLSTNPPSCFYCLPAGPEAVVEVLSKQAVAFDFEPLSVQGELQLLHQDSMGLFYRISNAEIIK